MIIPLAIARWKARESLSHERDPDVFYVTDLVRCPLKRKFEQEMPEAQLLYSLNGRILFGEVVHAGIETLLREIFGDRVRTERDEDLTREKHVEVNGRIYKVRGRIDAILDGSTGIEVKSSTSNGTLPLPWHVDQAMIYNWLYGFRETLLLYVTPTGIYQYDVEAAYDDTGIARMIADESAPRYPWECRYCQFASVCSVRREGE